MGFKRNAGIVVGGVAGVAVGLGAWGAYEVNYMRETNQVHQYILDWLETSDPLPERLPEAGRTVICAANTTDCDSGNALAVISDSRKIELEDKDIPEDLKKFLVSAENQHFYEEPGVSGQGYARAIGNNSFGFLKSLVRRKFDPSRLGEQGGSTIDMQVAERVYTGSTRDLTITEQFRAKGKEVDVALKLNKKYSKNEIIVDYINNVPGGRNTIGLGAASEELFHKPLKETTTDERIILSVMGPGPSDMDLAQPDYDKVKNKERFLWEMRKLQGQVHYGTRRNVEDGNLSKAEGKAINDRFDARFVYNKKGKLIKVIPPFKEFEPTDSLRANRAKKIGAVPAINFVQDEAERIIKEENLNLDPKSLVIETTLVTDQQEAAYKVIRNNSRLMNSQVTNVGFAAVNGDGEITALVGNKGRGSGLNFAVGKRGGGSGRHPGSTGKFLILTHAYDNGYTPNGNRDGEKISIKKSVKVPMAGGKYYTVDTGNGCDRLGRRAPCKMTPAEIEASSSNTGTAAVVNDMGGIEPIAKDMRDLGISVGDIHNPSIMLGSFESSPLEQAEAFAGVALNGGRDVDGHIITRMHDRTGKEWIYKPVQGKQVFSPQASVMGVQSLQQVVQIGTLSKTVKKVPNGITSYGMKSGTSDNGGDKWNTGAMCGPDVAFSFWVGHENDNKRVVEFASSSAFGPTSSGFVAEVQKAANKSGGTTKCNLAKVALQHR